MSDFDHVSTQLKLIDSLLDTSVSYPAIKALTESVEPYVNSLTCESGTELRFRHLSLSAELARDTLDQTNAICTAEKGRTLAAGRGDPLRAAEMSILKHVAASDAKDHILARLWLKEAVSEYETHPKQPDVGLEAELHFRQFSEMAKQGRENEALEGILRITSPANAPQIGELLAAYLLAASGLALSGLEPDCRHANELISRAIEALPKAHRPIRSAQLFAARIRLAEAQGASGELASVKKEAESLLKTTRIRHRYLESTVATSNRPHNEGRNAKMTDSNPTNLNIFHGGSHNISQGSGNQYIKSTNIEYSNKASSIAEGDLQALLSFLAEIGIDASDIAQIESEPAQHASPSHWNKWLSSARYHSGSFASKVGQSTAASLAAKAIAAYLGIGE